MQHIYSVLYLGTTIALLICNHAQARITHSTGHDAAYSHVDSPTARTSHDAGQLTSQGHRRKKPAAVKIALAGYLTLGLGHLSFNGIGLKGKVSLLLPRQHLGIAVSGYTKTGGKGVAKGGELDIFGIVGQRFDLGGFVMAGASNNERGKPLYVSYGPIAQVRLGHFALYGQGGIVHIVKARNGNPVEGDNSLFFETGLGFWF